MVRDLLAYSSMRDSGQNWLGEIPEYWELQRTKTLLVPRVEKGHPHEPLLAATQTKGVVRKDEYENRTVLPMKDLHLLKLVYVGDFVISLRSFQGGIEYARERGIISPAYTILYPAKRSHHGYLAKLFKSAPYVHNLALFVTGIRQGQNIDYERLSRSRLPLPPLPEQTAIVRFLDHADRRIRRYIRAKERLIALLEEQKQAIIHQVVTGQIDVRTGQPYPAYKDSGVEWLGEVPKHWEVFPLKYRSRCSSGKQIATGDLSHKPLFGHEGRASVPVIGGNGMMGYSAKGNIHFPTIAIGRVGALCGNVHVVMPPAWITDNALILEVDRTAFELNYVAETVRVRKLNELANQSAQPLITGTQVRMQRLPVPPVSEQTAIVRLIDHTTTTIDRTITGASRQIELLCEYQTRLIADVVTGKLDVRKAAAALPDVGPLGANDTDEMSEGYADLDVATLEPHP